MDDVELKRTVSERAPQRHRTIDRVTRILEQVVYNPGMTFAEIARSSGAAKSSVYGFVNGLLASGWLHEDNHRYYLGPAVYGLTMASGHIRAGLVSHADLVALHEETGTGVFLGVRAGDELIYVEEAGSDNIGGFEARSNIRRKLLATASGKILLAALPDAELEGFLRKQAPADSPLVEAFLSECEGIRSTGFAINERLNGTRFAVGTALRNRAGKAVAAVTLVGRSEDMRHRVTALESILSRHRDAWSKRLISAREVI